MTGKDLILYILQNDLEDTPVFQNDKFLGFLTIDEAAVKYNVGPVTVGVWIVLDMIDSVKFGDQYYIPANAECPKEWIRNIDQDVLNNYVMQHLRKE